MRAEEEEGSLRRVDRKRVAGPLKRGAHRRRPHRPQGRARRAGWMMATTKARAGRLRRGESDDGTRARGVEED